MMTSRRTLLLSLFACLAFGQAPPAAPKAEAPKTEAPKREPGLYATLQTSMGNIVIKLHEKESPITVKNFTDLARGLKEWPDPKTGQRVKRPLYNGLTFHRVIPGFMIQGGDPLGNGTGGTDAIKDEFHPTLKFDGPGKLAMANAASPGTGSCQFFITERETIPHLDGKHTIFGQVVDGQDLVNKIARVPRDANDLPRTPVRIVRVLIQREPSAAKPPAAKPVVTITKKTVPVTKTGTTTPKSSAPPTKKK